MKRFALLLVIALLLAAGCATPVIPPEEEPEELYIEPEPVIPEPEEPTVPPPPPEKPPEVIPPEVEEEPVIETVAFIITNDIPKEDPLWFAAAAWLKKELSSSYEVALIDMGGRFSGSPFADIDQGSSTVTLMNELSYDAALAGAGDFHHDAIRLEELSSMAGFPLVSTNIEASALSSSKVLSLGSAVIEVIGLSDPHTFERLHWSQREEARVLDEQALEHLIGASEADYRVLLSEVDVSGRSEGPIPVDLVLQRVSAAEYTTTLPVIETSSPLHVLFVELRDGIPWDLELNRYHLDEMTMDQFIEELLLGLNESQEQITRHTEQYIIHEINDRDDYGLTPLMNALQEQDELLVISRLLQMGASTGIVDEYGMTPFMYAAWLHPSYRVTTLLLRSSSDAEARDVEQWTPLMRAVLNSNEQVLTAVLREGAEVDAQNVDGWTALTFAAGFAENPVPVQLLLDAGADINHQCSEGMTPLMYAAAFNHNPEIIQLLLESGADVLVEDIYGGTAQEYAQQNRQLRATGAAEALSRAAADQR